MPLDIELLPVYPKGMVGGQGEVENCDGYARRIALRQAVVLDSEWQVECLKREWVVEVLGQVCRVVVLDQE